MGAEAKVGLRGAGANVAGVGVDIPTDGSIPGHWNHLDCSAHAEGVSWLGDPYLQPGLV